MRVLRSTERVKKKYLDSPQFNFKLEGYVSELDYYRYCTRLDERDDAREKHSYATESLVFPQWTGACEHMHPCLFSAAGKKLAILYAVGLILQSLTHTKKTILDIQASSIPFCFLFLLGSICIPNVSLVLLHIGFFFSGLAFRGRNIQTQGGDRIDIAPVSEDETITTPSWIHGVLHLPTLPGLFCYCLSEGNCVLVDRS